VSGGAVSLAIVIFVLGSLGTGLCLLAAMTFVGAHRLRLLEPRIWIVLPLAGLLIGAALFVFVWRARSGVSLLCRFAAGTSVLGASAGAACYLAAYAGRYRRLGWADILAGITLCYALLLVLIAVLAWSIAAAWTWRRTRTP